MEANCFIVLDKQTAAGVERGEGAAKNRYRRARVSVGLSARDAACRLGLCVSTLYRYERGETSPLADVLRSMALLYGVSSDWLIGRQ